MRQLTRKEEEQSDAGPTFAGVAPEQIFSKTASCQLANQIRMLNPRRYYELRDQYAYLSGEKARPNSYYDA